MREQDEAVKRLWSKTKNGLVSKIYEVDNVSKKAHLGKSRRINLKAKFKTVIDNLTMIVLLPSLLGAIGKFWYSEIHVAYIRFFLFLNSCRWGINYFSFNDFIQPIFVKKFTELALRINAQSAEQLANNFEEKL